MDPKSIAIAAPFLNMVLYGAYYAVLEQNYQKLSFTTALLMTVITDLIVLIVLAGFKWVPVDFAFIADKRTLVLVVVGQIVAIMVSALMYLAIKHVSATYLAFGELGYPIFVAFFAYILFGVKEVNWTMAAGGTLIVAGCVLLLYGKTKIPM
jgi:drug/metabolite transporter (DMT)-like permease